MVLRSTVTDLENLLLQLEQQGTPPDAEAMGEVAERIGKSFQVAPDEVAVMELSTNGRALKFILPQKLQAVGTIPLTSTAALAARTARERRSDIVNNFSGARHASVFEGVPLGRRQGEAIQKIMSAPILRGDKVIGVAQISRKGTSSLDAGPDFNLNDLKQLQTLTNLLCRLMTLLRSE